MGALWEGPFDDLLVATGRKSEERDGKLVTRELNHRRHTRKVIVGGDVFGPEISRPCL